MNTRAETITEYRAAGLEEMNMLRMNIGIEHGNYDYRRNYLKRNVKHDVQIRAFQIAAEHKYASCANSIIGMPDETRDLIFDTINFVRKLPETIDATGAFIFAPYHGTPLRTLAIEKGYIKEDEICSLSNTSASMLNMPTISKDDNSLIFAGYSVIARKQAFISSTPVICPTCSPMLAASSISAEPSEYHGSITQSCPKATLSPFFIISGTRVIPLLFG